MRRDAELDAGLADRADIGVIEIALAEMNPGRALVDRNAPIVVDNQRCARFRADRQRVTRFPRNPGLALVLDAQLNEPGADPDEPRDPGRAVDDRVEGVEAIPFSRWEKVAPEGRRKTPVFRRAFGAG